MSTVVVGLQWGDEGKGKIVDKLAEDYSGVVRFQGGHNAGHTLLVNGKKTVLRLIPSGILHDHTTCFIGNGVVVDIPTLFSEIEQLKQAGVSVQNRLKISLNCPLIMPYHVELDKVREQVQKIGTTKCGIGPAYEDKVGRRAIYVRDLFGDRSELRSRIEANVRYYNTIIEHYYDSPWAVVASSYFDEVIDQWKQIECYVCDVSVELNKFIKTHEVLFEGAQATMLDIDHGTYPFVTSSNTVAAQAAIGTGIGPQWLTHIIGVSKVYATRVGNGPFATELTDSRAEKLASIGQEFGSVTGRARRVGWLDIDQLRRSIEINGVNVLALTKLDVFDDFDEVQFLHDGEFHVFQGWNQSTAGATSRDDLPKLALEFLDAIEQASDVDVKYISTGRDREDIIIV